MGTQGVAEVEGGVVGLLAAILRDAPALPRALCAGEWETFDSTNPVDAARAVELCSWCPERSACGSRRRA